MIPLMLDNNVGMTSKISRKNERGVASNEAKGLYWIF
jgi:hypothetical protein